MLMIPLCDVPRRERRLLYCTDPEVLPCRRPFEDLDLLEAMNRSLSVHNESVDFVWPADAFGPDYAGISPDDAGIPIELIPSPAMQGRVLPAA